MVLEERAVLHPLKVHRLALDTSPQTFVEEVFHSALNAVLIQKIDISRSRMRLRVGVGGPLTVGCRFRAWGP